MYYCLQKHLEYYFIYTFITNGFPINFGIETETCNFNKTLSLLKCLVQILISWQA